MRKLVTPLLLAGALAIPAVPALAQPLGWSVTVGPHGVIGATVGVPGPVYRSGGYGAAYPVYPSPYVGAVPAYPANAYGGAVPAYPVNAYGGAYYPAPGYVSPGYLPPPRAYYRPAPVMVLPPAPRYYGHRHPPHRHHGWR